MQKLICVIRIAKALSDLIDVRDGLKYLPELDRNDVDLMIEDLCCN